MEPIISHSRIRQNVMRRVHTIRLVRPLISNVALASLLFVVAIAGLGREVWVARVFQNMPSMTNALALAQFFLSAFINTRTIVQATILVAAIAFLWLMRDLVRSLSLTLRFA